MDANLLCHMVLEYRCASNCSRLLCHSLTGEAGRQSKHEHVAVLIAALEECGTMPHLSSHEKSREMNVTTKYPGSTSFTNDTAQSHNVNTRYGIRQVPGYCAKHGFFVFSTSLEVQLAATRTVHPCRWEMRWIRTGRINKSSLAFGLSSLALISGSFWN